MGDSLNQPPLGSWGCTPTTRRSDRGRGASKGDHRREDEVTRKPGGVKSQQDDRCPGQRSVWVTAENGVSEGRDVSVALNWPAGRSLVSWTGAGVSPRSPAPWPPQAVGPSRQHLWGQKRGFVSWQSSPRSQGCRFHSAPRRATNPGVR